MTERRRKRGGLWLGVLTLFLTASPVIAGHRYQAVRFDQLLGWQQDDHRAALRAFQKSCQDISAPEWAPICKFAKTNPPARQFFELFFTPVVVAPEKNALFTGYFDPILEGSRTPTELYRYPIYRKPPDLKPRDPMLTREAIDNGALAGRGLEIAWVKDPVDLYYLHIQGSGRVRLQDGTIIRVGYAGENGHIYRSAARELVRQGVLDFPSASIEGVKKWFMQDPVRGIRALEFNKSYVFFRELKDDSDATFGALDRPLTGMRSIAVDPRFVQMGAPVWIEKGGSLVLRRLVVAQDTGSAIKGPQRADIFFGAGPAAGVLAGQVMDSGRLVVLLPNRIAKRLVPEG